MRDGIELWWNGTPPRKYTIIACLVQGGLSPLYDVLLIQKAKSLGGDAIIRGSRDTYPAGSYTSHFGTVTGYGNFATVSGSSVTSPIIRGEYQYYVIKYL